MPLSKSKMNFQFPRDCVTLLHWNLRIYVILWLSALLRKKYETNECGRPQFIDSLETVHRKVNIFPIQVWPKSKLAFSFLLKCAKIRECLLWFLIFGSISMIFLNLKVSIRNPAERKTNLGVHQAKIRCVLKITNLWKRHFRRILLLIAQFCSFNFFLHHTFSKIS